MAKGSWAYRCKNAFEKSWHQREMKSINIITLGDFPGGPVAKTAGSQCRGRVRSLVRELDPECHN